MADAEAIVQQIHRAFEGSAQPPREALLNDHCWECIEVSAVYDGKRWTDVSLEDVLRGRETSLLTASAWRYYLPAFLIWTIRAPEAVDVLQDNLVYQLEPPADGRGVPEWFAERCAGFSAEQRLAIVAYLEWYRERDAAMWQRLGGEPPRHVYNALAYWSAEPASRG